MAFRVAEPSPGPRSVDPVHRYTAKSILTYGRRRPHTALRARTRTRAWTSGHMRAREQLSLSPDAPAPRRRTKASIIYAQLKKNIHNYISNYCAAIIRNTARPHARGRVCVCQPCVCTEPQAKCCTAPHDTPRGVQPAHAKSDDGRGRIAGMVHMSRRITYVSMHACMRKACETRCQRSGPPTRGPQGPITASPPRRAAPAGPRAANVSMYDGARPQCASSRWAPGARTGRWRQRAQRGGAYKCTHMQDALISRCVAWRGVAPDRVGPHRAGRARARGRALTRRPLAGQRGPESSSGVRARSAGAAGKAESH